MAYIYRKLIHEKPYYYLRISKRVNGKVVVKDIAFLGNDLSNLRKKLETIPKKYSTEIRKGHRKIKRFIDSNYYLEKAKKLKLKKNEYLSREHLEKIEAIKLHYRNIFLKLNPKTIEETFENFLIDFAYNTTSIEGNTITLNEANKLLKENLTPKEKSLREIYDLQNTKEVFFYLLGKNLKSNPDLALRIHTKLIKNIDNRIGYRQHDVRVFKSHFEASPGKYVKTDVEILFKWFEKKQKEKMHPFVLSTMFHQKFEKIHPFYDGNGRTGRMLLNFMLISSRYPPLIIKKKNRADYLKGLAKADKSDLRGSEPNNYKPLLEYLAEEFISSYWDNFNL